MGGIRTFEYMDDNFFNSIYLISEITCWVCKPSVGSTSCKIYSNAGECTESGYQVNTRCHNPLGLGVYNGYNKIWYEIIVRATTILL